MSNDDSINAAKMVDRDRLTGVRADLDALREAVSMDLGLTDKSASDVSAQRPSIAADGLIRARLVAEPVLHGANGMAYRLSWTLRAWFGSETELPAGAAFLRPSGSDLEATFDYREPATMISCSIPYGTVEDPDPHGTVEDLDDDTERDGLWDRLLQEGLFSPIDDALVQALFGDEVKKQMLTNHRFEASVEPSVRRSWAIAGRIAVAQTALRRRCEPLDGLWALELAGLVDDLGSAEPLRSWARELLERAAPILKVLDMPWLGTHTANPPIAGLKRLFVRAREIDSSRDVGLLARDLKDEDESSLLQELATLLNDSGALSASASERILVTSRRSVFDEPALSGASGPRFLGDTPQPVWQPALIDQSAKAAGVTAARWLIDGGQIVIEALGDSAVPALIQEALMVRVTDGDHLVAAGLGLTSREESSTLLTTTLTLPPTTFADITVVLGRELPVDACSADWFDRQEQIYDEQNMQDAYSGVGQTRFVVELLRDSFIHSLPRVIEHFVSADADALAGARSLASQMGRDAEAAEWELQRRKLQVRLDQLQIRELETLAIAAGMQGQHETAMHLAVDARELLLREYSGE